jgi:hypothetical protein
MFLIKNKHLLKYSKPKGIIGRRKASPRAGTETIIES